MKAIVRAIRDSWPGLLAVIVLWLATYVVARGLREKKEQLIPWQRVTVALLPVPPFALMLVLFIRGIRSLDEMQRRIHLEALAIAFPLTMLLLMTLGLLQRAVELKFEDWSYLHVWAYLPLLYFGGLAYAGRRYQ